MLGRGLRIPVAGLGAPGGRVTHDPTGRLPGVWSVRSVPAPPGHQAALAVEGPGPVRLTVRRWELM
ncbi:hypothetical protein ACZ90_10170 [Streptomyces albus subsp. albus]|nr:hypothetical protein ACZ90_10170 [Streptomyces albus subsp. albus]